MEYLNVKLLNDNAHSAELIEEKLNSACGVNLGLNSCSEMVFESIC